MWCANELSFRTKIGSSSIAKCNYFVLNKYFVLAFTRFQIRLMPHLHVPCRAGNVGCPNVWDG